MAWNGSAQMRAALSDSHTALSRVDVLVNRQPVLTLDTVIGGSVNADADASVLRDATAVCIDETGDLTPREARDLLAPFGVEFAPYRGVLLPDGTQEWVPLGVFPLLRHGIEDLDGAVRLTLTGLDRAVRAEGSLGYSVGVSAGTPLEVAIVDRLLARKVPGMTAQTWATGYVTPALVIPGDRDVWGEARRMARDAGGWLHHDRLGRLVMNPYPTVAGNGARHYREGADATFADARRVLDTDDLVNVIVVEGTNTALGSPLVVEVADRDPNSPTSVDRIGRQVATLRSERVGSIAQAQAAGMAELARRLGATETVTFAAVPDPTLDPLDPILITREPLGLVGRATLVESIRIPLSPDDPQMEVTCRRGVLTGGGYVPMTGVA